MWAAGGSSVPMDPLRIILLNNEKNTPVSLLNAGAFFGNSSLCFVIPEYIINLNIDQANGFYHRHRRFR